MGLPVDEEGNYYIATACQQDERTQAAAQLRGVVMKRVESYAREHGRTEVTEALLREVRSALPVDFSKRKPFFLRDD